MSFGLAVLVPFGLALALLNWLEDRDADRKLFRRAKDAIERDRREGNNE